MPLTTRIGVALVLIGVALHVGWARWAATRTWVPLDVPISLSRGHTRTGEFKINLESKYWMEIEVERKFDFDGVPCMLGFGFHECKDTRGVLRASWLLSNNGQSVACGDTDHAQGSLGGTETMGRELGSFSVAKGQHFVVDLDVLGDSSQLNAGNPRLRIFEEGGSYPEYEIRQESLFLATFFFLPFGSTLLIAGLVWRNKPIVSLTEPGPPSAKLCYELESGPSTPGEPRGAVRVSRFPTTARLGIVLIFFGLPSFACIQYWMATRTFVPVDMPVSLARGHIKTGPFAINLRSSYSIQIDMDEHWWFDAKCNPYSALQARSMLYKDGQTIADETSLHDGYLGYIDAEKGIYNLDIEVLSDASCLDASHPRLRVSTSKSDYDGPPAAFLWLSALCAGVGISLVALSGVTHFSTRSAHAASAELAGRGRQNFHWAQMLPLKKGFSGPPPFGLVAVVLYCAVVTPIWLLEAYLRPISAGISVHLVKPGTTSIKSDLGIQPIILRLTSGGAGTPPGTPPVLDLQSRRVSWSGLETALKEELRLRPDYRVYLEADPNLEWQDVVKAVDIIKGVQADVVLLTPDTQRALRQIGPE